MLLLSLSCLFNSLLLSVTQFCQQKSQEFQIILFFPFFRPSWHSSGLSVFLFGFLRSFRAIFCFPISYIRRDIAFVAASPRCVFVVFIRSPRYVTVSLVSCLWVVFGRSCSCSVLFVNRQWCFGWGCSSLVASLRRRIVWWDVTCLWRWPLLRWNYSL